MVCGFDEITLQCVNTRPEYYEFSILRCMNESLSAITLFLSCILRARGRTVSLVVVNKQDLRVDIEDFISF